MVHLREIILILFLLPFVALSTNNQEQNSKADFMPTDYDLFIKTTEEHYKNSTKQLFFTGKVIIYLTKTTNEDNNLKIKLNISNETKIINVTLKGGESNENLNITSSKNNETLLFEIPKVPQTEKKFILSIDFENPFGDDMSGFYRSSYTTKNSETRWLLTTQFEPIFARKAFPCFDVPNIKTNYNISISVPKSQKNYYVLCNTPVGGKLVESKDDIVFNCKKTITPMSSYLVAFTVSDFKSTAPATFESSYNENQFGKSRKIITHGREEVMKDASLGQAAAKEAVTKLTKYLGIGYAYEKVDQVGIPDFSAGAMENWGHISYREKYLFFDEKTGATVTKQSIVLTITHELVHQWFGNLVTLDSWDYIWLNEAFATYVSYVIAAKIQEPNATSWEYMTQFLTDETHLRAFETDGLNSSKPLSNKIADESLIFSSFNDIPYSKGASVLRMWDLALGKDLFQKSLNNYLNARKEQSALPVHLKTAFKNVAGMNDSFFDSWTINAGYPVVTVKTFNSTHYKLTQKRFFWEKPEKDDTTNWTIPITFITDKSKMGDTKPQYWLKNDSIEIPANGKWIIVNYKQSGYYRVNYEKKNWEALAEALKEKEFSRIHEFNRAQIINDVYSLARSVQDDYVPYSVALRLTEYLTKENSYIAWKTALHSFDFLQAKIYSDKTNYNKFKEYILQLLKPHFKDLNCTGQQHVEKLKKIQISRWACALDYEPCLKQAKELYKNYTSLPDTQEIILCTTVRTDDKRWKDILTEYLGETDSSKKAMYLSVLGCTENQNHVQKLLNLTLDEKSGVRKQDQMFVLSSVYNGNLKNVELALKFVENNFEKIAEDFGGINPLGRAVMGIAKKLESDNDLKRMKALAEKIKKGEKTKAARDSVDTALSIIEGNKKWAEKRKEEFKSYFKSAGSFLSYSIGLISLSSILIFQL